MPSLVRLILLEDAFFFLNQAKSFSTTPTAAWARSRCIRVAILLCWQALEYSVKDVLRPTSTVKLPNKFFSRLVLALKRRSNENIFDKAQFLRFSKLRNDVAHVNTGARIHYWRMQSRCLIIARRCAQAF
jgi:hypothetical protein